MTSGDAVLFNDKGNIIIGQPGCSTHFFLGLLSVFHPATLECDLKALHSAMLSDPNLNKKESFLPKNKKTFFGFHAKDDLSEVRDLVFDLLVKNASKFRFFAVVKDKDEALRYVIQRQAENQLFRYDEKSLYDHLVYRLFETRLTKSGEHNVYFAHLHREGRIAQRLSKMPFSKFKTDSE